MVSDNLLLIASIGQQIIDSYWSRISNVALFATPSSAAFRLPSDISSVKARFRQYKEVSMLLLHVC